MLHLVSGRVPEAERARVPLAPTPLGIVFDHMFAFVCSSTWDERSTVPDDAPDRA